MDADERTPEVCEACSAALCDGDTRHVNECMVCRELFCDHLIADGICFNHETAK